MRQNSVQRNAKCKPISQSHQKGLKTNGDRDRELRLSDSETETTVLLTEFTNWSLKFVGQAKPRNGCCYFFFWLWIVAVFFYAKFGTDSQRFETELRAKWPNG